MPPWRGRHGWRGNRGLRRIKHVAVLAQNPARNCSTGAVVSLCWETPLAWPNSVLTLAPAPGRKQGRHPLCAPAHRLV